MPSYEFQSSLYRTVDEMVDAIADAFLSADGNNGPDVIREVLATQTDEELAAECVKEWGLDHVEDPFDDDPDYPTKSHMAKHSYTASDLADAFAELRKQA